MGFYKNVNATLSPLYIKFLSAKKELKLPDGTTILNILAIRLLTQGFIRQEEYDRIKEAYGVNWGSWRCWDDYCTVRDYWLQTNKTSLSIKPPQSKFNRNLLIKFLKAMNVPQIDETLEKFNTMKTPLFTDKWFFENMEEYKVLDTVGDGLMSNAQIHT